MVPVLLEMYTQHDCNQAAQAWLLELRSLWAGMTMALVDCARAIYNMGICLPGFTCAAGQHEMHLVEKVRLAEPPRTSLRIWSVTRQPFSERTVWSSTPRSVARAPISKSGGTCDKFRDRTRDLVDCARLPVSLDIGRTGNPCRRLHRRGELPDPRLLLPCGLMVRH